MLDYEGAKCGAGHLLELVAEGYAICTDTDKSGCVSAWAFSQPAGWWTTYYIIGRDEKKIPAWLSDHNFNREEALAVIQADIDARRAMPFDEEEERARLMPV